MSMPQRRKAKGKRARDEGSSSQDISVHGFAPINNTSTTSSLTGSRLTQSSAFSSLSNAGFVTVNGSRQQSGTAGGFAPPGKVAIPALRSSQLPEPGKSLRKGRTSHACDFCRKAKAGCTGGQPCQRCKNANVECIYGDGKRDKDRRRLMELSQESSSLSQLHLDIAKAVQRIRQDSSLSADDMRLALDEILAMMQVSNISFDESQTFSSETHFNHEVLSGEEDADADVGSTGSIDVVNVDTDLDDTRATGHLGKSSAVTWAKRTADEFRTQTHLDTGLDNQDTGFAFASYHTEEADFEPIDTSHVDMYVWPEVGMGDLLVEIYFDHVHPALPLLDKHEFLLKYHQWDRNARDLPLDSLVWLGIFNLVFGIASVYAQLTKRKLGHYSDHLIFVARAKRLCLDEGLLYKDPRVTTTGALGLLCVYFVVSCQLNRAWIICGVAIRNAMTLGLHVRSQAKYLPEHKKEYRIRVWWSLYSLECLLNELTGRPSCISDRDSSQPLPLNVDEEVLQPGGSLYNLTESIPSSDFPNRRGSRGPKVRLPATYQMPVGSSSGPSPSAFPPLELPFTTSTYFIYRVELSIISHEIVTQLYCAATIKEKWFEVQDTIRRIDERLLAWRDNLPPDFDINFDRWTTPDVNDSHIRQRLGLAMLFHSARMILFRPCLCRFEGRIRNQSVESKDFNQQAVSTCVHSARMMICLISWAASPISNLYSVPPWWSTLHYLCEALSVLMLEMAFQAHHLPDEAADILSDAKKGIMWLRDMAETSVSARKAWEIFDCLIRLVAPMISWSVYDLPTSAPIPPGYNWHRFSSSSFIPLQNQLSQSNLRDYEETQSAVNQNAATNEWHQQQHRYSYDPSYNEPGFLHMGEQTPNPLDGRSAMQKFGNIRGVHGLYDDEWRHMFPHPHRGMEQGGGGFEEHEYGQHANGMGEDQSAF